MADTHTRGETHGCIVCGKLYELYVVYDSSGRFVDLKVMTPGGRPVPHPTRPLVACVTHSDTEIEAAVVRVYGDHADDDED